MFVVFSDVIWKRPNLEVSCVEVTDTSHTLKRSHGYNTCLPGLSDTTLLCPFKEKKKRKKKELA